MMRMVTGANVRPEAFANAHDWLVKDILYPGVSTSSTPTKCGMNRAELCPTLPKHHPAQTTVRPELVEGLTPLGEFPRPLGDLAGDLAGCGFYRMASSSISFREALNKLIPLMSFDFAQDERQVVDSVRGELVEGLGQRFPKAWATPSWENS